MIAAHDQQIVCRVHSQSRGVELRVLAFQDSDRRYVALGFPWEDKNPLRVFRRNENFVVDRIQSKRHGIGQFCVWALNDTNRGFIAVRVSAKR